MPGTTREERAIVEQKMINNRTSSSDTFGGGRATTAYCYDNADRLTGTTVTGAVAGASAVAGGNLTTTGPGATLAYDAHGNTIRLADQVLEYMTCRIGTPRRLWMTARRSRICGMRRIGSCSAPSPRPAHRTR